MSACSLSQHWCVRRFSRHTGACMEGCDVACQPGRRGVPAAHHQPGRYPGRACRAVALVVLQHALGYTSYRKCLPTRGRRGVPAAHHQPGRYPGRTGACVRRLLSRCQVPCTVVQMITPISRCQQLIYSLAASRPNIQRQLQVFSPYQGT